MAVVQFSQWNGDRLTRRLPRRILEDYGPTISFQLQQEISTPQFPWPVTTLRKSGELVPAGNRDIVDTGELLTSQKAPEVADSERGAQLQIVWTAPYSGEVLRGGYLVGTTRTNYLAPERDWITPALEAQDPAKFFVARWRQLGSRS